MASSNRMRGSPPSPSQPARAPITSLPGPPIPRCRSENLVGHGLGLHLASTSDWRTERDRFCGPLGVSAHSELEVKLAAHCGCKWAFLSPVARPTSKPGDTRPPIGEAAVLRAHPEWAGDSVGDERQERNK